MVLYSFPLPLMHNAGILSPPHNQGGVFIYAYSDGNKNVHSRP
jgi:hypothetical protein